MGKYERERNFRCPECWLGYNSATSVASHRLKSQGECIMYNPAHAGEIAAHRLQHGIAKALPLPAPQV